MKLTGTQFYWLILAGLCLPAVALLFRPISGTDGYPTGSLIYAALVLGLFAQMCWFVVIVEMWRRYGIKLLLWGLASLAVAFALYPAAGMLLLAFGPLGYWIFRINGWEATDANT